MQENIHPSDFRIKQYDRLKVMNQRPVLLWFTGLSGSGKSTLANGTEVGLHRLGFKTYLLDGDNIRCGLNNDLDFSREDRVENIRRIAEVSRLMMDAGLIRSEEHTSELQSRPHLVCRLLLEKKKREAGSRCSYTNTKSLEGTAVHRRCARRRVYPPRVVSLRVALFAVQTRVVYALRTQ